MPANSSHIDRLRTWRVRRPRTTSLADLVPGMQQTLQRQQRRTGNFAQAWHACVPPALRDRCRVDEVRGGVARVTAANAAITFQLDRLLRSGLLAELRRACVSSITRVDVRTGTLPSTSRG